MSTWYDIADNTLLTVRVGSGGAIETNEDPLAYDNVWVARTSGVSDDLFGITWNGYLFAAVGANGTIVLSSDGIAWVTATSGVATSLNAIAAAGIVLLTVGHDGVILQSNNGGSWAVVASGTTEHLRGVSTSNGTYLIVGDNSTVLSGSITTDVLEIHVVESIMFDDTSDAVGTFNSEVVEALLFDDASSRTKDIADANVFQFIHNRLTFGNNIVHEVAGDIESGVDDSVTDLDVVVTDSINMTGNDSAILGGAGSGIPQFVEVSESILLSHIGNFDGLIGNSVVTDGLTLIERWFQNDEIVREAIAIGDTLSGGYGVEIVEQLVASDILAVSQIMTEVLEDNMSLADELSANAILSIVVVDDIALTDGLDSNQVFELVVTESLSALAGFWAPDDGSYAGLTINTKNKSITEYTDFDFNSMFMFNNQYYGVNDTGVHLMGGDTDTGDNIVAALKTGLMDFGDTLSRVARAYIGMRNDGEMVLKTITRDPDGSNRERYYIVQSTSDAIRTARVRPNRKVKARYWQFELVNMDGADFEVADIDFTTIKLSRRV